ncbi:MAG TPA: P-loop NTPase fold protein, partial [Myxococcaceae bacterium]|nr:P-loop NTPase fold protein [Myxococcaceae bacterium]
MKPSTPHALALPLEEARSLLTRQILDGEALQGEARRLMGRPQLDAIGAWRASVMSWSDSSEHLLRRIFASPSVPDEFARRRRAWRHSPATSAERLLSNTLGEIESELKALHGIFSELPEAEPEPQAPKSAAGVVQTREQRRTYHAVQSTSVQDLPSGEDLLGFRPYVEALAAFLANERTQPPLTLSIEGEWGSGKSSFMLQLEAALRRELKERARFIRFNAWRHDKGEALWSAFALEFSRQLMASRSWPERWWRRLRLGLARLRGGQGWLGALLLFIPLSVFAAASWVHREVLLALDAQLKALLALVSSPLSVPIIRKVWSYFGNP